MGKTRDDFSSANRLLLGVGLLLVAVGVLRTFIGPQSDIQVGGVLFLGVALVVLSVFEPRMEGDTQLSPHSLKFRLKDRLKQAAGGADTELAEGEVGVHSREEI